MDWNDVAIFLSLSRCGSVRDAARVAKVDPSTVSRRLAAFERSLGARLFDRLPTGLSPTAAAGEIMDSALRMEAEYHGIGRRVAGRDTRMSGLVRLTLPRALSELAFAALRRFGELHPEVEVESLTSDVTVDLNGRQADVALRIADAPPEHLVGQRIARLASAIYASEAYRRAHPLPLSSDEHRWVDWAPQYLVKPALAWVAKSYPHRRLALRGLSTHDVLEAVVNGVGLGALPCVLETAQVVRLEMSPPASWSSVWVLTHREVRPSARVRALASFLAQALRASRARIEGKSSPPV
jgi:DNA-binding transcriptional LysR family regulator